MESAPVGSTSSHPSHGASPELLQRLHDANARFHEEKKKLEGILASNEQGLEHRLEPARKGLAEAEKELEEITKQINESLTKSGS